MKTITTKVYNFDELNDAAKEKARQWWKEGPCVWDHGMPIESIKMDLAIAGFDIDKVYFSGFYSQGDGACFEGKWSATGAAAVALEKMREHAPVDVVLQRIAAECERIAKAFPAVRIGMKHRGRESHEYSVDFDLWINDEDGDARELTLAELEEVEKDLIAVSRDAMRWAYRQLRTDYEYHNEDEQVDEVLRINEYTFTEDGERFG